MTGAPLHPLPIAIDTPAGAVSGLLLDPPGAEVLLVLAHGAGAGMRHRFMEALALGLAGAGIATLRYQFPYMEKGGGRPDSPVVAAATVRSAVGAAAALRPDHRMFAGGKSFGGRMTSTAAALAPLEGVRGMVFVGFPLHPPNQPGVGRADHLDHLGVPMLFLQGTRDLLADPELMRPVAARLGSGARLHEVEGADHAFQVLKRSGRSSGDVIDELVRTAATWMKGMA